MDAEIVSKLSKIILQKSDITFAYIHGSFLTQERFNDIDIALYVKEKVMDKINVVDFEIDLSLEIEEVLKIPVDVRILNSAPLSFKYQTSAGYLLFSLDEERRENFLCNTWSQYFDFFPVAQDYLREVLSG
ncbi:MAG: nucleotidyltransferase domain-containing protein [bacterium]|nr:nucleotidyltransferase domain-containing protein [bacterium]